MKFVGGKFEWKVPDPLRGLADIIREIRKLEFGTPAGLVNFSVLAFAVVLVIVSTFTNLVEDIIRIFKSKAVAPPIDFGFILIIFLVFGFLCVGMLMINDRLQGGTGGGKHSRK